MREYVFYALWARRQSQGYYVDTYIMKEKTNIHKFLDKTQNVIIIE